MAKPNFQQSLNSVGTAPVAPVKTPAAAVASASPVSAQVRQVHKPGEVNISAYFPAEMKSALRMVQAKTGQNVKQCLAEALQDFFRKHNVPVTVPLDELRA